MQTASNSEYKDDFNKICQLEADVEVLEKKVADYTRIEEGIQNTFNELVKKLAEVEVLLDELRNSKIKKFKAKITRKYDDLYEKNANLRDSIQKDLDSTKYRLQDTRGKLKDTKKALADTKAAYKKQREYMKRQYSEFNDYEKKLENEKQQVRSVLKEIDEAIVVVEEVIEIAKLAYDKFKSARAWGFADMVFDDGLFCEIFKYNNINDAEGMVYALNAAIARMNKELKDVNNVYGVYCQEFGSGLRFMDFVFDSVFVDWMALHRIEENMNRLNSLILQLGSIKDSLYNNRRQAEKQLKNI